MEQNKNTGTEKVYIKEIKAKHAENTCWCCTVKVRQIVQPYLSLRQKLLIVLRGVVSLLSRLFFTEERGNEPAWVYEANLGVV